MGTQIVRSEPQQTAMQRMGSQEDLALLADRFALFYNVPEKDMAVQSTRAAALKAAQLTIRFGFTPGVHVYMVKRGGTWAAEESLEAWKEAANKHSRLEKFLYDVQTRPMTPEQVKAATPPTARYTPEDCGFQARVIRFDIARQYQQMGMQYDPEWVNGFWRKEAYEQKVWNEAQHKMTGTGKWEPDTIPNQRTPSDVARRRAMRAALKETFSLIQLDDYSVEQRIAAAMMHMQREMEPESEETTVLWREKPVQIEEDGDVIWATPDPRRSVIIEDAETVSPVTPAPAPKANGHTTPLAGAVELAGDADKATAAFHAQGTAVFNGDWEQARPWMLLAWTEWKTPQNVRKSSKQLTVAELGTVRRYMSDRHDYLLEKWQAHKASKAAELATALEAAAAAPEMNPDGNPFEPVTA